MNALSQEYDKYVKMYSPLDFDCSTDELFEFLSRSEEPICEMCPDKTITSNIIPVVDKIRKITYNMH